MNLHTKFYIYIYCVLEHFLYHLNPDKRKIVRLWIKSFSSRLVAIARLKGQSALLFTHSWSRKVRCIPFPRWVLLLCEIQTTSSGFKLWSLSPFPMTITIICLFKIDCVITLIFNNCNPMIRQIFDSILKRNLKFYDKKVWKTLFNFSVSECSSDQNKNQGILNLLSI